MKWLVPLLVLAALLLSAASAGAQGSGEPAPVGDLQGWRQLLVEDFNTDAPEGSFPGSAYGSRWSVYADGTPDTTRRGVQMPSRVLSVQGGLLTWRFRDNASGVPQVASTLPSLWGPGTSPYTGQMYGRYSVRFYSPSPAAGYMGVFLLWPDDDVWPEHGEVDFPAGDLLDEIRAYTVRTSGAPVSHVSTVGFSTWHTATIEWTPTSLRYLLDGAVLGTVTSGLPTTPMHWVLQTDTTDYSDPPAPGATATLQVDWAAAWAYSPGTVASSVAPPAAPVRVPSVAPAAAAKPSGVSRTADGRVAIRITAGSCRKKNAITVGGTIAIRGPSTGRRKVMRMDGRVLKRPSRIRTSKLRSGLHHVSVHYTSKASGRRLTGCRWIRVLPAKR